MNHTRLILTAALLACTAAAHAQTTITFLHAKDLHAHLTPHKDLVRVPGTECASPDNFESATAGQLNATTTIGIRGGMARRFSRRRSRSHAVG